MVKYTTEQQAILNKAEVRATDEQYPHCVVIGHFLGDSTDFKIYAHLRKGSMKTEAFNALILTVTKAIKADTGLNGLTLRIKTILATNHQIQPVSFFNAEGEQVIENAFKMGDRFASVGFVREDGDFELLATFNNNTEYLSDYDFYCIVTRAMRQIAKRGEITDLVALNTEYASDVVELDELSNT